MRIVTQGKVYMFYCKCCGCEFVEGAQAMNVTKYDPAPVLKCPCCGSDVRGFDSDKIVTGCNSEHNDS